MKDKSRLKNALCDANCAKYLVRHPCIWEKKKQSAGERCRDSTHNRALRGGMIQLNTTTILDRPLMVQVQDRSQLPNATDRSVVVIFQTVNTPYTLHLCNSLSTFSIKTDLDVVVDTTIGICLVQTVHSGWDCHSVCCMQRLCLGSTCTLRYCGW